ncbi:MAG: hypothetical protein OXE02_15180 [Chloroflexi bacterium]|nr:hypothetical protein [Chloroflexota bacterium]
MGKATKPYIRLLRVSTTRLDGGAVFGATAKQLWERFVSPDRQNRVSIGNYSLLIDHPDGWVLVNTGPGDKPPLSLDVVRTRSRSSMARELKQIGLMPKDIAVVIQTDLFSEYAGGCTHFTSSGRVLPTFPNARYIVHKDALEEAMRPSRRNCKQYRLDDVEPLLDSGQLELVDSTTEVCSGVWVEPAAGPTPGHQIVLCQQGNAMYAFLGMLVPTSMHLSPTVNAAYDWNPEATARTKVEVKRQAALEGWLVAPVGRDEWVRANQLESLEAFSLGRTALPEPTKTRRVAAPARKAAPATSEASEPVVTPAARVPA